MSKASRAKKKEKKDKGQSARKRFKESPQYLRRGPKRN
jgi:hypothetical protein